MTPEIIKRKILEAEQDIQVFKKKLYTCKPYSYDWHRMIRMIAAKEESIKHFKDRPP